MMTCANAPGDRFFSSASSSMTSRLCTCISWCVALCSSAKVRPRAAPNAPGPCSPNWPEPAPLVPRSPRRLLAPPLGRRPPVRPLLRPAVQLAFPEGPAGPSVHHARPAHPPRPDEKKAQKAFFEKSSKSHFLCPAANAVN